MAPHAPSHRPWVKDLDRAGWPRVADRIIHGISHSLNGRITALSSVLYFLQSRSEDIPSLSSLLEPEVEQLEEANHFLRLLPDDGLGAELLAPGEVLPRLSRALSMQRGLETTEVALDVPPEVPGIRVDRALFVRAVLLLLTRSAEMAGSAGHRTVSLEGSDDGGGFTLTLEVPESDQEKTTPSSWKPPMPSLPEDCRDRVADALEKEGIRLDGRWRGGDEVGGRVRIRFPPP